jgi:hypothetical protein
MHQIYRRLEKHTGRASTSPNAGNTIKKIVCDHLNTPGIEEARDQIGFIRGKGA